MVKINLPMKVNFQFLSAELFRTSSKCCSNHQDCWSAYIECRVTTYEYDQISSILDHLQILPASVTSCAEKLNPSFKLSEYEERILAT